MPLTNSYNATATANEQPEYQVLWFPSAVDVTVANALIVGQALAFTTAGVGSNPGPGGDADNGTPYTTVQVTPAPESTTGLYAGVFIGGPALGAASYVPNSIPGNPPLAMVGVLGICQVLVDDANGGTTIGHTLKVSAATVGAFSDSGGTTVTTGTTTGIVLQTVTISSGTALVWASINRF